MTARAGPLAQAWALASLVLLVRVVADGLLADPRPPAGLVTPHRIDVNRATVDELTALPGCGRTRAEAIVVARIRSGPFRGLADLERVDGVGPAFAAAVAPWVVFGGDTAAGGR